MSVNEWSDSAPLRGVAALAHHGKPSLPVGRRARNAPLPSEAATRGVTLQDRTVDLPLLGELGWLPPPGVASAAGHPVGTAIELSSRHRWSGDGTIPGGDFYDFLRIADGRSCFVLGDVSGAGLHASRVAMLARRVLRDAARLEASPTGLLGTLNNALLDDTEEERYCTVVLVTLDPATHRATVVSAGHPLPRLVSLHGAIRAVGRAGMPIGLFPSPELHEVAFDIDSGQTLVLFTDGVTEARLPTGEFVPGLLDDLLAQYRTAPLPDLTAIVIDEVVRLQEGQPRDDIAVLGIRRRRACRPPQLHHL